MGLVSLDFRRYTDGTKLATQELSHVMPSCLTVNPANWRQIAYSTDKELIIWNIEACDETHIVQKQ